MSPKFKLISSLGELVIPILLFYWWKWDLHYILLFLYIDIAAALCISFLKEQKIKNTQKQHATTALLGTFTLYITIVLISIILFEFAVNRLYPEMHLWHSFLDFLWEEELGIPQIVLLVPLLFLVNYQQYTLLFIRTQQYRVMPLNLLQTTHKFTYLLFLASATIFCVLSMIIQGPLDVFLFLLLSTKLVSDLWLLPKIEQKSLHKLLNSPHVHTR
jgi:hypothetical protein